MSKTLTTFDAVIEELKGDHAVALLVGVRDVTVRSWRVRKRFPCMTYKVMTDALPDGVSADPALWGMIIVKPAKSGNPARRRSPKVEALSGRGSAA